MKHTIFKIAFLALLCGTMVSCKKFLEKEPVGRIGKQVLFQDIEGAKTGLIGSYNRVFYYYKNEFGMYGDIASDNLIKSTTTSFMRPQFDFQSTIDDDELAVGHIWLNILQALNNTNNVLNSIPTLKTNFPNRTKELEGIYAQALVLRALCHFDLSRVYAQPYNFTSDASHLGIPILLKTPSPGESISRNTMKETYEQIIKDLNDALPELKTQGNSNQFFVNYQAALGLLSRVYLYKGDWDHCVSATNLAISDISYNLATAAEYSGVFNEYPKNATTKSEILFQLTGVGIPAASSDIHTAFSDALAGEYNASKKILDLFSEKDIRKTTMFKAGTDPATLGKSFTRKFSKTGKTTRTDTILIKIVRLSELYLNRAEAKWNQTKYNEAKEDLRFISQRAHPTEIINISYSDAADLYKQIADERNRELCFENHRLFDIVRRKENLQRNSDCNATVCSLTYPNNKFILPIPRKEIDASIAMQQNPGYN